MVSRQALFIGKGKMDKLRKKKACIVGCGSLGSKIAFSLAKWGVGSITLVDRDFVGEENVSTQQFFLSDVGMPKSVVMAQALPGVNPYVVISYVVDDLNPSTAEKILRGHDVIIDATDNFETRFLINDFCVKRKVPMIFGAVLQSEGMTAVFNHKSNSPCLKCVFNENAKNIRCDVAGVTDEITALIAGYESTEAVKILIGEKSSEYLVFMDVWKQCFDKMKMKRNENCACCGKHVFRHLKKKPEANVLCGSNAIQITGHGLNLKRLEKTLVVSKAEILKSNIYLLRFKIGAYEFSVFEDGRTIIHGLSNAAKARQLYKKYVG